MRNWIVVASFLGLTLGLAGCGGSEEPKKDAEGKAVKAPEVPPTGP